MECDSPGECSPESDRRFDNVCGSHIKSQIERPDETHLKMTRTDYQKVGSHLTKSPAFLQYCTHSEDHIPVTYDKAISVFVN